MRVRSEWITIFTVTSLAVCGLALPRHAAPAADKNRKDVAAAGVDLTPTGTIQNGGKVKSIRHRQP